jgi:hypothetical protein
MGERTMKPPAPLEIGMYVKLRGQSNGRIVDRGVRDGAVWWLVKLQKAGSGFLWARGEHLTAKTDA